MEVRVKSSLRGDELRVEAVVKGFKGLSIEDVVDSCYVAFGSAISEFLNEVSSGWGGIRFPGTYVIRNVVVGFTKVVTGEEGVKCSAVINCSLLPSNSCVEGSVKVVEGRVREALREVLEGFIAKHVINYGRRLANLGEEVEVVLTGGEVVKGEVMGYGFKGELVLATTSGVVKVRPSQVAMVRTTWP